MGQFLKATSTLSKDLFICLFHLGNTIQKSLKFPVEGEVTSVQFSLG